MEIQKKREKWVKKKGRARLILMEWIFSRVSWTTTAFSPNQSELRRLHYPIFTRAFSPLVKDKPSILATHSELDFFISEQL